MVMERFDDVVTDALVPGPALCSPRYSLQLQDLNARLKQSEIGEEHTGRLAAERFERRGQGQPGSAGHRDALANASNPTLAGQSQPNG